MRSTASRILPLIVALATAGLLPACSEMKLGATGVKSLQRASESGSSGLYKVGSPYQINGVWYYPAENYQYAETGIASFYGGERSGIDFHGRRTANGELYDMGSLTAAHQTLPMPSLVRVTNLDNGRQMVLRVNDRGPFVAGRIIDVSRRSAQLLGFEQRGIARVRVEILADESRQLKAELTGRTPPSIETVAAAPRTGVVERCAAAADRRAHRKRRGASAAAVADIAIVAGGRYRPCRAAAAARTDYHAQRAGRGPAARGPRGCRADAGADPGQADHAVGAGRCVHQLRECREAGSAAADLRDDPDHAGSERHPAALSGARRPRAECPGCRPPARQCQRRRARRAHHGRLTAATKPHSEDRGVAMQKPFDTSWSRRLVLGTLASSVVAAPLQAQTQPRQRQQPAPQQAAPARQPAPPPSNPLIPETSARQAIIADATTGTVLFEKSADDRMPPASMSKIMTAYVVFDALKRGDIKMDDTLPVSERAWRMQGSKMFVPLGERVRIDDLLRGMIIQSGNDACIVLAEGLAGSEEAFAERMNQIARAIGLTGSNFRNSSGWPDPDHYMTARDLMILGERLIENFPEYYKIYAERDFTYGKDEKGVPIKQGNRNPLLYRNTGADGIKTGTPSRPATASRLRPSAKAGASSWSSTAGRR
jgi:rare lipoprotein A (peptidoglycan hydrolase)